MFYKIVKTNTVQGDNFKCLVLTDQQSKSQRDSVYYQKIHLETEELSRKMHVSVNFTANY